MEEQFILRVPPSVAQRLHSVLSDKPDFPDDESIDLSFSGSRYRAFADLALIISLECAGDGRSGKFVIGSDEFDVSLVDLPCVVESYKTYDDSLLIKTADVAQMILVRDPEEAPPTTTEYRHGLTPPMRDARRRRFRRRPDINPDYVQQIEEGLQNIMAGGTAGDIDVEVIEQEEDEEVVVSDEAPPPASNSAPNDDDSSSETESDEEN